MTLFIIIVCVAGVIGGVAKFIADKPPKPIYSPVDAWETVDEYWAKEEQKAREKDYLRAYIANLEDLQRMIEDKPHDEKQLRQLITLDKQIHTAQAKLEKLG